MTPLEMAYRTQLREEIERIPSEYLEPLLKMLRAYRESLAITTAEESFAQGWREAIKGDVHPLEELWQDVEVS